MKRFLVNISLIGIFLFLISFGCKDKIADQNIDDVDIPSTNVSFSQHIQPVFNFKCTNSGCHNGTDRASDLDLESYAGTVARPDIVVTGSAELSKIVWAVQGTGGPLMPPLNAGVTPFTDNQTQGLKTWINEGAKAN